MQKIECIMINTTKDIFKVLNVLDPTGEGHIPKAEYVLDPVRG